MRQRTARETVGNRFALQQLHDQVVAAVLLPDVVERADVGMVQARDSLGFALEALGGHATIGLAGEQQLDRDFAIEAGVFREVHLAHATRSERGDYFVRAQASAGSE